MTWVPSIHVTRQVWSPTLVIPELGIETYIPLCIPACTRASEHTLAITNKTNLTLQKTLREFHKFKKLGAKTNH